MPNTDWQACGPAAQPHPAAPPLGPSTPPPPPPGALALLSALRSRVAAAEAALAARQAGLDRKRALLADAEALVGELCGRTTATTTAAGGDAPLNLTITSTSSRLLRSGDWAVTVGVRGGDAGSLARAALLLVPVDSSGAGATRPPPAQAWEATARPARVLTPPGQPPTALLTAVVPRAHALVDRTPSADTAGPALEADAVVVVPPPATTSTSTATTTTAHAGRVGLGWDALLARAAGVAVGEDAEHADCPSLSSSDDESESGVDATARTCLRLAGPVHPPTLTPALARVLGPHLSTPTAGTARLLAPDLIELTAPSLRRLARLVAGVAAALSSAGLSLAEPPALPTHTPATARRRAARLATAARAMVEEVDAVHAALVASLRLVEGGDGEGGGGGSRDPGPAWAAAEAAGEATDAAVAACWR
jgi:hypothetical protein